jgi:electron transport complex protein RnfC
VVEVSQQVEAGQLIGRAEQIGAVNVHAPLAGRVAAITRVATASHADAPAVQIDTIDAQHTDGGAGDEGTTPEPCTVAHLAALADEAGIVNVRDPAVGLGEQLRRAGDHDIRDVIINGMSYEPMLTAGRELLWHSLDAVMAAGVWVRAALGARYLWLTIDRADRELVSRCRMVTQRTPVRVAALQHKYPQATPVLLAWSVTGRAPTYGHGPEDAHTLVLELEPLIALEAAVRNGQPMVDRVVTVAGSAIHRSGHYRIPMGTSFADVLRHVGLDRPVTRVIDGGSMTGRAVTTLAAVVTRQTGAILVMDRDHEHVPVPGPCVRCGWCQEACPVGLDPLALLDAFERRDLTQARSLYPHACLECSLCSYVCPSELPLAEAAAELKRVVPIDAAKPISLIEQAS